MGGYISKQINSFLEKYTYNFEKDQISLKVLQGSGKIENLFLNNKEINKILDQWKIPLSLKFGLLKKFELQVSYFSQWIESIIIDSLIVIVGENQANFYSNKGTQEQQEEYLLKAFQQLKLSYLKQQSDFSDQFKDDLEEMQNKQKQKQSQQNNKENKKFENPEILSVELLEIIKNLLCCKISIGNVYIVYENNIDFLNSGNDLNLKQFNLTIYLKSLELKSEMIEKYLDKNQIFKNYLNFEEFLKKSGTLHMAQDVYWSVFLEQFKIYFGSGDFSFYEPNMDLEKKKQSDMEQIMNIFKDKFVKNMGFSFELLAIFQSEIDIIIFYKDSSQIPINAVFLNFSLHSVIFNLKNQKMELILDIIAYYQNLNLIRKFLIIKPKVSFNSQKNLAFYVQKFKIDNFKELKVFQWLNRIILRDYFLLIILLQKYSEYLAKGLSKQQSWLLVLKKFSKSSGLYNIFYGRQYPKEFDQEFNEQKEQTKDTQQKEQLTDKVQKLYEKIDNMLQNNSHILYINKTHFHVWFGFNFEINIFGRNSYEVDQKFEIQKLYLDFIKPIGQLKFKLLLQLVDLELFASNKNFPGENRKIQTIFEENENKGKQIKNELSKGKTILSFQNCQLDFQLFFQRGKNNQLIVMLYSNNIIGDLEFNYYPKIFQGLVLNFQEINSIILNSFRISLSKQQQQFYLQKSLSKGSTPRSQGQNLQKSQNFESDKKKSIFAKENRQDQELHKQMELLNKIFQNLVIGFDLKTHPVIMRVHDRSNNEQLLLKYQNQDIKVHIDLAFKEILSIKALGLEIQSKRSIYSLRDLLYSLYEDLQRNLEILSTEIWIQNKDTYPNYLSYIRNSNQVSYLQSSRNQPLFNEEFIYKTDSKENLNKEKIQAFKYDE